MIADRDGYAGRSREYLDAQYDTAANLSARASLHDRFSTNRIGWFTWVFEQLELREGHRVLEVGCGAGWLWASEHHQVPSGCTIAVTDRSAGMVAAAEAALGGDHRFQFAAVDVDALPFGDAMFDVVVANHMLYHATDLDRSVAELRRVVGPGGRLVAATNGPRHLVELTDLDEQVTDGRFDARARFVGACEAFGLHNGRRFLARHFHHVVRREYADRLAVTEVEPIVAYLESGGVRVDQALLARLRTHLARRIERDGAIEVTKDTGLFIANP